MPELDLQELPPLIYQVLLYATKGLETLVLSSIVDHFNALDTTSRADPAVDVAAPRRPAVRGSDSRALPSDQIRQIEGSVLLHINFAMKQDQVRACRSGPRPERLGV